MKKKVLFRSLLGAPIGLAISTAITIVSSLIYGDGNYYAVVPEFIQDCGSEINAVALQALLSLLYGAVFSGASVIWEREDWSPLKQTVLHLLVCSAATFPVAYTSRWMSRSVPGILLYAGIFFAIYASIWCWQYFSIRKKIIQMNRAIRDAKNL